LGKNSKKGIYKISDPFMNFYFTYLVPNLSRLELGLTEQVYSTFESRLSNYVSFEWENLCRRSVPMNAINGIDFDIAKRWWGTNSENEPMELDVVAESIDKKFLLVGECKWSIISNAVSLMKKLEQKAALLPLAKGKKVITVLYVKETSEAISNVFIPKDVLERLK